MEMLKESYEAITPKFSNYAADYDKLHAESLNDPETFWRKTANKYLSWIKPYDILTDGGFEQGDVRWFEGGKLNVAYNCIDRHLTTKSGDKFSSCLHVTLQNIFIIYIIVF